MTEKSPNGTQPTNFIALVFVIYIGISIWAVKQIPEQAAISGIGESMFFVASNFWTLYLFIACFFGVFANLERLEKTSNEELRESIPLKKYSLSLRNVSIGRLVLSVLCLIMLPLIILAAPVRFDQPGYVWPVYLVPGIVTYFWYLVVWYVASACFVLWSIMDINRGDPLD